MNNVTYVVNELDGVEYAVVDNGDGSFNSMTKTHYEAMQAAQAAAEANYLTPPAILESNQPDEADLTEGTN